MARLLRAYVAIISTLSLAYNGLIMIIVVAGDPPPGPDGHIHKDIYIAWLSLVAICVAVWLLCDAIIAGLLEPGRPAKLTELPVKSVILLTVGLAILTVPNIAVLLEPQTVGAGKHWLGVLVPLITIPTIEIALAAMVSWRSAASCKASSRPA
jgi:hypothetical protein